MLPTTVAHFFASFSFSGERLARRSEFLLTSPEAENFSASIFPMLPKPMIPTFMDITSLFSTTYL